MGRAGRGCSCCQRRPNGGLNTVTAAAPGMSALKPTTATPQANSRIGPFWHPGTARKADDGVCPRKQHSQQVRNFVGDRPAPELAARPMMPGSVRHQTRATRPLADGSSLYSDGVRRRS